MNDKMNKKKGELTATQIIIIVMAIIGFVIVLVALFLVDFGGYSEKDICQLSVLTRATAPSAAQAAIPLKCRTAKICLYDGIFSQGRCKEQFAGEDNVQYVRLSGSVVDKRNIIEQISANAMYDCWDMMGQGKLDLFGSLSAKIGYESAKPKCVVCSRVAIDSSVGDDTLYVDGNVSQGSAIKINDYMRREQIPGQSLTYLQAFTDRGISSSANVKEEDVIAISNSEDIQSSTPSNNEMAFVFMQIKAPGVEEVLGNLGTVAVGTAASVFLSPAGGLIGKVIGVVGSKVVIIGTVIAGVVIGGVAASNALEGQNVAAIHCGSLNSNENGCSIVQGMSYKFDLVNNLCSDIEGEL